MVKAGKISGFDLHNPWVTKILPIVFLALFCVIGVFLIYKVTPFGMGINGDSYQYIFGADTLAAGYGIGRFDGGGNFKPLTHYPPMLSIILAGLKLAGMQTLTAARHLNAALFCLDILLVALIIKRTTQSYIFALMGSALFLISPAIITIHTWIWSEPPFLFFELVAILCMAIYLEKKRLIWLIISSISIGLSFLTRYTGFALVTTAAIALLFAHFTSIKRKFRDLAILLLVSCTPIALWLVRNYFQVGNAANRNIHWRPMTSLRRHEGIDTVLTWLFPADFIYHKEEILVFFLMVIGLFTIGYWLSHFCSYEKGIGIKWPDPGLRFLFSLLVVMYIAFLVFSISFVDPATPLDFRILSPVQVPVIILITIFLADLWINSRFPVRILISLVIVYIFVFTSSRAMKTIPEIQSAGQGYANLSWRNSPLIHAVKNYPNAPIITNQITGIYIWAGRSSWPIPWRVNQDETAVRSDYPEQLALMRDRLSEGAILVLHRPERLPKEQYMISDLIQGLTQVENFYDGSIYKYNP
jgi:hypothetical protein